MDQNVDSSLNGTISNMNSARANQAIVQTRADLAGQQANAHGLVLNLAAQRNNATQLNTTKMLPKQFQIVNDISRNPQEQLVGVNTDTMNIPMTKDSLIKLNDTILSQTQEKPAGPYKTNKETARKDLNADGQMQLETAQRAEASGGASQVGVAAEDLEQAPPEREGLAATPQQAPTA